MKDNQPKVSIIMINYNGYEDTISCISSLRNINYQNYEVLIVDNASTNDSVERINSFIGEKEILISSKENGGFSAGNNIGINYALNHGADYCLLLNNDTVVDKNFLNELIEPFSDTKCGLTIGKILYESKPDTIWYAGGDLNYKTARTRHLHYREKDTKPDVYTKVQEVSFATGCCMCISRAAIESIGLMNEDYFMYVEDVEYCIKLHRVGYKILYVPSARIYHKVNASTEALSSFSQYYCVRNKLFLIKNNFNKSERVSAFLYTAIQDLYRCMKKEYKLSTTIKAYSAFLSGETGRSSKY